MDGEQFPIVIEVTGEPKTAGSKVSGAVYRKGEDGRPVPVLRQNGRVKTFVKDDNPKSKAWQSQVAQSAGIQYLGPVLREALVVEMTFRAVRPKGHFGTGRNAGVVKDSAPAAPGKRPDVLKLARAVEDALTGVLWSDDAQITDEYLCKRYGDQAGVTIRVWPAEVQTVGDLLAAGKIEPPKPAEFEQLPLIAA